ncbi:MAG: hypothetical protein IJ545_04515 [Alphaproteobacteria bacterium]|nr:hypothetical protein [Alphaproteobacteria bacterium]
MTINAQDAIKRFSNEMNQTERKIGNMVQSYEETCNRIFGRKKVKEEYKVQSGIQSFQSENEALLIGNEVKIEVTLASIYVESIHGSRFIERNNYGRYTVVSNLNCSGIKGCWVEIDNNRENTVVRFYCRGNNNTQRVFDTYWIHQYQERPLNRRYGGVNHRSTYRPKHWH